jgi:hypothetical protein
MDRDINNAKTKEPRSNSGTVASAAISFHPENQRDRKPTPKMPKKTSRKLLMILSISLSASDNIVPSEELHIT